MSLFTRTGARVPEATGPDERTLRIARKRFARRQWARRWLAWRRLLVALLAGGLLVGAVWTVFFSSLLAVSGVRVDGTAVLDPRSVRRVAAVPLGGPLATVDLDAVAARVEQLAAVKSVDVSRSWPDRVLVSVSERNAVAVVDRGGVLRGLDADGVIFRRYPSRPKSLPVIRMGDRTRADALAEAATVAGALPATIARRVDFVEVRTVDTISLRLRNGRVVRWGSADDSAAKAEVLAVLLRQRASLYDVTVAGQPIIRR
jgi:cell division protein FtsQ